MEPEKEYELKTNIDLIDNSLEILRDVLEKRNEERQAVVRHAYQLVTTIGVVAGFGFTALPSVKGLALFIVGEVLLLSAIAIGIWYVQPNFLKREGVYKKWIDGVTVAMDTRQKITPAMALSDIKRLMEEAKKMELNIFNTDDGSNDRPDIEFLKIIFYLFCIGTLLVLSSFVL